MNAPARFAFKPAVLEQISLLIGLAGGTGSGKTYTGMRLATGLALGKRFAVIDTEAGRAKHYARQFAFDHGDLAPPFRPESYTDAILAADQAGYPVIMVDSCSHEWAGEGGILDWHDEELDRMAGEDWKKRESCNMAAWIRPKSAHKKMVSRLLQIRAHLILCFRAEEKIEMVKDPVDKKMKIVPKASLTGLNGWIPICEKNLPFELTASFLLTNDAPGLPKPIKLEEQHRAFFALNEPISEISGKRIGEWAMGSSEESEYEKVLTGYARCADEKAFADLEVRRKQLWDQDLPAGQKPKLKKASDDARARLGEAPKSGKPPSEQPNNAEWIAKFTADAELGQLDDDWLACTDAFGGMVPLDVSDSYESNRERLIEQAARAE